MVVSQNRATPSHHPFLDGISLPKTIQLLGYLHFRKPAMVCRDVFVVSKLYWWCSAFCAMMIFTQVPRPFKNSSFLSPKLFIWAKAQVFTDPLNLTLQGPLHTHSMLLSMVNSVWIWCDGIVNLTNQNHWGGSSLKAIQFRLGRATGGTGNFRFNKSNSPFQAASAARVLLVGSCYCPSRPGWEED